MSVGDSNHTLLSVFGPADNVLTQPQVVTQLKRKFFVLGAHSSEETNIIHYMHSAQIKTKSVDLALTTYLLGLVTINNSLIQHVSQI